MKQEERDEICLKLFNKKENDVKWVMYTNYVHTQLINGEDCLRTGLYSWIPVWNGEVKAFQTTDPKEYGEYDIIHVNMSGQDIHIIGLIKEELKRQGNTTTKVVANNDYTVELWQSSFDYLPTMRREINYADVIFGTEPYQVGALEVMMGRKIHTIVHPAFVKRLKTLRPKGEPNSLAVMAHRYDMFIGIPSLVIKGLGYETRLIGYEPNADKKKFVTSCNYNKIMPSTNYMDFCDQLMDNKVVVDPFTLTSQSRTGWDCAAMGVPLVGSDRNYSVRKCYPFTCCDPNDIKKMRELVKKLLDDDTFRKKVIDYAQEAVEYVSYRTSKDKYLEALKEGSPNLNKEE